ncbi:unnamed protein product [Dovyalis caffra]|uniref:Uncharacterized protein n=1 Tax=Dovyalis caffra TaxID=77055 RepID=A0AAV1S2F5_9ROSI|nr:unnamed protein product [Dovyalis caffra]
MKLASPSFNFNSGRLPVVCSKVYEANEQWWIKYQSPGWIANWQTSKNKNRLLALD